RKSGIHFVPNRKSRADTCVKKLAASITSTSTMPTVVRIEIALNPTSTPPTARSRPLRLRRSAAASRKPPPARAAPAGGTTPWSSAALSPRCSGGVVLASSRSTAAGSGRGACRSSGLCDTGRLRQLRQLLLVAVRVLRDVSDLRYQLGRALEVEANEFGDMRLRQLRVVHVDHERPRERRVRPACDGLVVRQHTTIAVVDAHGLHPLRILDVVGDRKSTRLNSSHVKISYAVFCLKKKIGRSFKQNR